MLQCKERMRGEMQAKSNESVDRQKPKLQGKSGVADAAVKGDQGIIMCSLWTDALVMKNDFET